MARPKKESKIFDKIKWNIEHTNNIRHLESDIVALVEWREEYPRTDKQYHESRDLLEYAFDKYNDLINGAPRKEESGFCSFLSKV